MFVRRAAVMTIAALAAGLGAVEAAAARGPTASDPHALNGNAEAHLHLVHSSGSTLIEEGAVSGGGLSGHMRAQLNVGPTFSGRFTFYTRAGQIMGRGSAHPHGSGRYESFSGTVSVTGGSGRYAHVSGHGAMYGTFDRRTYNVTIQTRGTLHY
jgi:hypothetical protein